MFTRALRSATKSQRQWLSRPGPSAIRMESTDAKAKASTGYGSLASAFDEAAPKSSLRSQNAPKQPAMNLHISEMVKSQFIKPSDLSFESRTGLPHPKKRPLLGPSAKESKRRDVFYQMNVDPLHESFNSSLLSSFVTSMGKIQGRAETGLTWKSQRRLGKSIRRAKMMGIIPILCKRPLWPSRQNH